MNLGINAGGAIGNDAGTLNLRLGTVWKQSEK